MSLRKLKVRLDGLPWESRFGQAILGGPHIPQSEALASIVDLLQVQLWQNSGNENAPRPKPFPRVGDDLRETAKVDAREARALAWLAESKALKGGE